MNRGGLSDAQSSKKLKGQWKKASSLGMRLTAKAGLHCLACNESGLKTDGVIDHIISNTHEHNVSTTDWKYKLHLAGGFTRGGG